MHSANLFATFILIMYKVPMTNEQLLKQIRTKVANLSYRGITQKHICKDIGMNEGYFSQMLHGNRGISVLVIDYFKKVKL